MEFRTSTLSRLSRPDWAAAGVVACIVRMRRGSGYDSAKQRRGGQAVLPQVQGDMQEGQPAAVMETVMSVLRRVGIAASICCLFLASSCGLAREKATSITVESIPVRTGAALRVSGQNWRPGEQVLIGLSAPQAEPRESLPVATASADAAGSFVALFTVPSSSALSQMPEIWVVARSGSLAKLAIARFDQALIWTPTPALPAVTATPAAEPVAYVLGRVTDVSVSAHLLNVRPIEGPLTVISLAENAEINHDGGVAELKDIRVGDLIEAVGKPDPVVADMLVANRVRILIRATAEPTLTLTPTGPALLWKGEYYNNTTFSGNPALKRNDPVIDFQWQDGAAANGLPADAFAVRWTGSWPFETGAYRFYAQVDDGVRIWLDEHLIVDQWYESTGALYSADAYLSAGSHAVRAEYFDGRGTAYVRVWWQYRGLDAAQIYPNWKGEYFSNRSLSGAPVLIVDDRLIAFDWGAAPPASGLPSDDFSARWTRTVTLDEGTYRFSARVDDGMRLWVNDEQLFDYWEDGGVRTYSAETYLPAGQHTVRVEYYEHGGMAVIQVGWERTPATPTPTEPPTQTPTIEPSPTLTITLTATATRTPPMTESTPGATSA